MSVFVNLPVTTLSVYSVHVYLDIIIVITIFDGKPVELEHWRRSFPTKRPISRLGNRVSTSITAVRAYVGTHRRQMLISNNTTNNNKIDNHRRYYNTERRRQLTRRINVRS